MRHGITVVALVLTLCMTAAYWAGANQQLAAEDYATALGVSSTAIWLIYDDGDNGEELWGFVGGTMQLDSSTGELRALNGNSSAPFNQGTSSISTDQQAITRAEQFLSTYASGLGMPSPGEEDAASVSTDAMFDGRWVDINTAVGGMAGFPCWSVRVADSGAVLTCVYTEASGDMPSATPTLSQQQAAAVVATETGDQVEIGSASLSFELGDDGAAHLVWTLALEGQENDYGALVDAHSGDILWLGQSMGLRDGTVAGTAPAPDAPAGNPAQPGLSLPVLAVGAVTAALSLVIAKVFQK